MIRRLIQLLLLGVIGVSLFQIGSYYWESHQSKSVYKEWEQTFQPEKLEEKADIVEMLKKLQDKNPDVMGWIEVPGTIVSYPIVQGTDNEFYLHHTIDGAKNKAGAVFLDYRNDITASLQNLFVYGHNRKDGTIFHELIQFGDPSFFEAHPTVTLYTETGKQEATIFAAYEINEKEPYILPEFGSEENQKNYIDDIYARAKVSRDTEITGEDTILSLSTCTDHSNDIRWVLHAVIKN